MDLHTRRLGCSSEVWGTLGQMSRDLNDTDEALDAPMLYLALPNDLAEELIELGDVEPVPSSRRERSLAEAASSVVNTLDTTSTLVGILALWAPVKTVLNKVRDDARFRGADGSKRIVVQVGGGSKQVFTLPEEEDDLLTWLAENAPQ